MFSKPLFKQSCKANAVIWSIVTFATCFMLAIIILIMGNASASNIRTSLTNVITDDYVDALIQKRSMDYFVQISDVLDVQYTEENILTVKASVDPVVAGYNSCIANGMTKDQAIDYITTNKGELAGKIASVYSTYNKTTLEDSDKTIIAKYTILGRVFDNACSQMVQDGNVSDDVKTIVNTSIVEFVADSSKTSNDLATTVISRLMSNLMYDTVQKIDSVNYTHEKIEDVSKNAIFDLRAKIMFEKSQGNEITEELIESMKKDIAVCLINDDANGIVGLLPSDISESLAELGSLDVYGLVIGSIFFRMAGLLLPIVFTIMVANNLIAGQVDSGSMAYVLSTPTKRKQVTCTQMIYLVSSLLVMFILTTITSLICLRIVNSPEITLTYKQLVLFNLGAFLTMFAIGGICFLASAWFNRSKNSMGVGGGLSIYFLVATILGLFGSSVIPSAIRISAMKYFNYTTLISMFDAVSILEGTHTFIWKWCILVVVGIVAYGIGIWKFNKKDLPL